jgi:hypothetical protein
MKSKKKKWAVIEEEDGIHVRPLRDGKIIDTPIVKKFSYREKKTRTKSSLIKLLITDKINSSSEFFNKNDAQRELIRLLKEEDVVSIEVFIEKKEPACSADSKN